MAQAQTTVTGSINLLPQIAEKEIKTGVYKQKVNIFSIAALLVVFAIVAGLFAYQLFLATRSSALDSNTETQRQIIRDNFETEIKQRALVDKLQAVKDQFDKNKSTSAMTQKVLDLLATGKISLSKVDVDYSGGVSVSGKSNSSAEVAKFIEATTDDLAKDTIEKVVATSIIFKEGNYQFTIRFNYTKAGLLVVEEEEEVQQQ